MADTICWRGGFYVKILGKYSLYGTVGKDFVYHACGHEFESRLKWKISNFPHHLLLLLSNYRGMAKCFRAHYNQEVRFSSAVKCKTGPQVLTPLLNQRRNYYYIYFYLFQIRKLSQPRYDVHAFSTATLNHILSQFSEVRLDKVAISFSMMVSHLNVKLVKWLGTSACMRMVGVRFSTEVNTNNFII